MNVEPLWDTAVGSIGTLSWWIKRREEVPEKREDELRTLSMSGTLHAALLRWANGYEEHGIDTSVRDGWELSKDAIEQTAVRTGVGSAVFVVGDPANGARLDEIESAPDFSGWLDPELVLAVRSR